MKPYIKNGKMGVLISPNYGSGWSSAYNDNRMSWDERVIKKWLELKDSDLDKYEQEDIMEAYLQNIGYDAYMGGYSNLVLEWVGLGEFFFVKENDGHEELVREKDMQRCLDEKSIFMETRGRPQGYSIHEKARDTKAFVQLCNDMRKVLEDLGEEYTEIDPKEIRKNTAKGEQL